MQMILIALSLPCLSFSDINLGFHFLGEQGLLDEAQRALEEAEALKKVCHFLILISQFVCIKD